MKKDSLVQVLDRVRTSLWFVPGVLTLAAVVLAWGVPRVDRVVRLKGLEGAPLTFSGSSEGALAVLATVAGATITIACVVFSMTVVALQLASSQFGPRLLRTFMRDRGNQVVLGTFVATFLYSVMVLPSIGEAKRSPDPFVPYIAVSLSMVLALVSLAMLVYFIDHLARSIQADSVIAAVTRELLHTVDREFPERGCEEGEAPRAPLATQPDGRGCQIRSERDGYLRFINIDELMEEATAHDAVIRLEVSPGPYILPGELLATAWGPGNIPTSAARVMEGGFVLGPHRTSLQDVAFVFEQLVEMSVRALSPAINDPITACHCIDRIGSGLARIVARPSPPTVHRDRGGTVRIIDHEMTLADLLARTVRLIRRYAAGNTTVWITLLGMLAAVHARALRREDRAAIEREAAGVQAQALDHITAEDDRAALAGAMRRFETGAAL